MKILVFNPSYPPVACGVGDYTQGLAAALTRAGHDVAVVTATGATMPADGPPRVLPLLDNWDVSSFVRGWPRFAQPRADLVVTGFPAVVRSSRSRLMYLLPAVAKALLGWPRVTYIVHEFTRTGELHRRLLALALFAADRVVTVTEAERDAIAARYPALADRIVVRHNAPSIPVATDDAVADGDLRSVLAPRGRPVIAFFGFIWAPDKGFEELLAAMAQSDVTLVVTGSLDPENAYHNHVAAVIERLGLAERIRWLGFVPAEDVGRVLRVVDAVVLPFRRGAEGGYTSLLAALVNGAAVITTRGPQNPTWLRDLDSALLVDPEDVDGLARALRRVLSDGHLATRIRAGARALEFGWDEIVAAVTDVVPARRGPHQPLE
jgi:glycosyltransferase involved in cell wall biosynthesis